jgi:hypothetical protein
MNWDQIVLLDAQSGATSTLTGSFSLEIPVDATALNVQVNQSGTASTVVVQASLDNAIWHTMFTLATSTTLHAVTVPPRYLRAYTTGTADSHVIAVAQFKK